MFPRPWALRQAGPALQPHPRIVSEVLKCPLPRPERVGGRLLPPIAPYPYRLYNATAHRAPFLNTNV